MTPKNYFIYNALTKSIKNALTSGTTINALCAPPYFVVTAVIFAIAVGVDPSDIPPNPEIITAAS